ncbi:hypothetical protein [Synoicihabitans lomoniglobus]|uniref:DUF4410 domain-containing protein n=1 Tax=Synoicihabitans lomoniglobus TaxID=2909285 RepID=A0AAF0CSN8_9BACT|nr:hypothetical protein [Opitutaceae bacterium LMO-M01]WED67403.1 hypothetical protein PXH66_11140 [Opitutaceae bacterium LMO-M01]
MKKTLTRLPAAFFTFWLTLGALAAPLRAISVVPPTLTTLVGQSEEIVRASVAEVESRWVESRSGKQIIKTFVRLRIKETAKGPANEELTLSFFGGTVDGYTMAIAGMPTFRKGQQGWFFVKGNNRVICPLNFAHHGAYLLQAGPTAGSTQVMRLNGAPLRSTADIGDETDDHAAASSSFAATAMTSDAFRAAITQELNRLGTTREVQP